MSKNTTVTLSIRIKGSAAADLSRMGRDQVQVAQKVNQTWSMTAKAQGDFVNMTRRATQETKQTAVAGDHLLRTNRMLEGVLRQQAIQTRLLSQQAKSQTRDYTLQTRMLSEQARHARDLQRSMAGAAQSQRSMGQSGGVSAGGLAQGAAGVAGGVYAASQIIARPVDGARTFERGVSAIADIVGSAQNMTPQQRHVLSKDISDAIWKSTFSGGSSSEGMNRAAQVLAASGVYDELEELSAALADTSARAYAANADPENMARLRGAVRMFGTAEKDSGQALNTLHASGQVGGFEIADMSQFFPDTLTFAKKAGYEGLDGLLEVATMQQVVKKNTATAGQASTNLNALLSTLGGGRLTRELDENITWQKGDPFKVDAQGRALRGKNGLPIFDSATHFVQQAEKGMEPAPAHIALIRREVESRESVQQLQQKLTAAKTSGASADEIGNIQKAIAVATNNIMAQMFVRQEQVLGLLPLVEAYANGSFEDMKQDTARRVNATDESGQHFAKTEWSAHDTLIERQKKAEYDSYMGIADGLTTVKTAIANWAGSNEEIAAAGTAAAYSLLAVAAAGGIAAFAMGKNGVPGGAATGALASAKKWLGRAAAPLAVGVGVLNHNQIQSDQSLTQDQKNIAQAGNVGGTAGALAGAAVGAAWGAPFFGIGAVPGSMIGGALGYWGGSELAEAGESAQIAYRIQADSDRQIAAVEKQTQEIVKALQANQQPREVFGGRALFNAMNETVSQQAARGAAISP